MLITRWTVKSLALRLGLTLALLPSALTGAASSTPSEEEVLAGVELESAEAVDELLVGLRGGVSSADAELVYRAYGAALLEDIGPLQLQRIRVAPGAREAVEQALARHPEVKFVERNTQHRLALTPNDPSFPQQWHLVKIGAPQAWDISTGSTITIAIVDTGVDGTHPDLATRMVPGYNFYSNNTNTSDVQGHGTLVAGVAVAAGNNAMGGAGVSWNSRIMPLRVTDTAGSAATLTIANAVTYAADHGARVINLSFEGLSASATVNSAATYARSKGAIVVTAAGNCGCLESYSDSASLISVSATDKYDVLAYFSSRGNHVDLAAPGFSLLTTAPGGGYVNASGTSVATAVVSGTVALMAATNPGLSAAQLETLLEANADDLGGAGWDSSFGVGRVNAYRAVAAAAGSLPQDTTPPTVSITAPAAGALVSGSVTVNVTASDNVGVTRVDFYVDGVFRASDAIAPYSFYWNTTSEVNGLHTLTARAVDVQGNVGTSAARTVDVENSPPTIVTPSPLPVGTVGLAYAQTLLATGGIPPYVWSIVGGTLPPGLGLGVGGVVSGIPSATGTFTFRVRVTGANALFSEKDLGITVWPAATEIIIDNTLAGVQDIVGGRTFTGTWCRSSAGGYYGADSLYSCGSVSDTYRWTPTIVNPRSYDVYVRWTAYSTRGTAVPITVRHAAGQTTRTYNEQTGGGQWVLHGRYSFNVGTTGWAETSDAAGQACADAVRFVPVP